MVGREVVDERMALLLLLLLERIGVEEEEEEVVTAAAASTPLTLWRNDRKQGRVSIVGDDLKIWLARRSLVAFIGLNSVSLLSARDHLAARLQCLVAHRSLACSLSTAPCSLLATSGRSLACLLLIAHCSRPSAARSLQLT